MGGDVLDLTGGGAIGGPISAIRAQKDQREANRAARARQRLQERKGQTNSLRQSQVARAQVTNQSFAQNLQASSGSQGGISAISQNLALNQAFSNQVESLNAEISDRLSKAGKHQAFAQVAQSATQFVSLGMDSFGGSPSAPRTPAPVTVAKPSTGGT